jgi:hypothetical protein
MLIILLFIVAVVCDFCFAVSQKPKVLCIREPMVFLEHGGDGSASPWRLPDSLYAALIKPH